MGVAVFLLGVGAVVAFTIMWLVDEIEAHRRHRLEAEGDDAVWMANRGRR